MSNETQIMVSEVAAQLGLTPLGGILSSDRPVTGAMVSDLLSYVMAQGKPGHIWITVQGHANIVAVATLSGLSAIIIADGFQPESEAEARAEEEDFPLFTSPLSPYVLAGKLYEMGIR